MITQQVIFTATPLTIALALNTINRQRQFISIRQLPDIISQLPDIYDDLISVNGDYRFHKLEIQEKLERSEQNLTLLRSDLEQFDNFYYNEISKLYDKISVLENQQHEAKINQRKQASSTRKSPPPVRAEYKTEDIYQPDNKSKNNTRNKEKTKPHDPLTEGIKDIGKRINGLF